MFNIQVHFYAILCIMIWEVEAKYLLIFDTVWVILTKVVCMANYIFLIYLTYEESHPISIIHALLINIPMAMSQRC